MNRGFFLTNTHLLVKTQGTALVLPPDGEGNTQPTITSFQTQPSPIHLLSHSGNRQQKQGFEAKRGLTSLRQNWQVMMESSVSLRSC